MARQKQRKGLLVKNRCSEKHQQLTLKYLCFEIMRCLLRKQIILPDTSLSLGSYWNSFTIPALTRHCRSTEQCMVSSNYKFPKLLTGSMDLAHSLRETSSAASPQTSRHFLADSSPSGHKNTMLCSPATEIINIKGKSRVQGNSCIPLFFIAAPSQVSKSMAH